MTIMTQTMTETEKKEMARQLNEFAETVTYRDVAAVVHVLDSTDEPHPPAPAWYIPALSDVFIHVDAAQYEHRSGAETARTQQAKIRGLVCHELAHSRWSRWMDGIRIPKKITGTVTLFEEMRIESRAVNAGGRSVGQFIKAALPLAIGDTKEVPPTRAAVARLWALGYGRALTTVATDADVDWIDQAARTLLGDDDVDFLRDLLQEAIELYLPGDKDRMFEIAEQWVDLVGDADAPTCVHGEEGEESEHAEGDVEDSMLKPKSGEPTDDDGDEPDVFSDVLDSVSPDAETRDHELDPDDVDMIVKEVVKMAEAVSSDWSSSGKLDMADPMVEAARVFGGKGGRGTPVKATAREFSEIRRTAKALESMSIPAVTKVPAMNIVPPGRLRTREAVRGAAERSMGVMSTAKPWQSTKRTHSHVKPIVIGIATDISGSMKWAEKSVAQFAYIWTHAGQRVGARTAAVTFGDTVERVAGPGEVLPNLLVRTANGGTEVADRALAALDGVLRLSTHDNAAKLLIIVSDGMLVITGEMERVVKRVTEMRDAGTTVIWVTNADKRGLHELRKVATVVSIHGHGDAALAGIQKAALGALEEATK